MQTMDQALMQHLKLGNIDGESAFMKAFDKTMFEQFRDADGGGGH
jgi:hypothetical protein